MPRVPPRLIIVPTIAAAAFAALGGSSLLGQQPGAASSSAQIQNPVAATPKSIDSGRQLYQRYCRPCHGEDAQGDGPQAPKDIHPPSLADAEWKYGSTDGEIFRNIRDGIGPAFDMKPMKSRLTTDETWNIVNYLRSLSAR